MFNKNSNDNGKFAQWWVIDMIWSPWYGGLLLTRWYFVVLIAWWEKYEWHWLCVYIYNLGMYVENCVVMVGIWWYKSFPINIYLHLAQGVIALKWEHSWWLLNNVWKCNQSGYSYLFILLMCILKFSSKKETSTAIE